MSILHAVLDPQNGRLAMALYEDDKQLTAAVQPMRPRDASIIPGFVEKTLAATGHRLTEVARWTFGAGPGSFTFLRVVAAIGAGWTLGREEVSRFRCVPGALAYAGALALAPGESGAVLYDAKNEELLRFGLINDHGVIRHDGSAELLNAGTWPDFAAAHPGPLTAAPEDLPVLTALTGGAPIAAGTPDLTLLKNAPGEFDNVPRMCYLRPAVAGSKED